MKHLIGKQVWLKPYGNTARYMKEEFVVDKVVSVKRVNVELESQGKLRINERDNNYLENAVNGGFLLFESLEEFNIHNKKLALSTKLSRKFNYNSDWNRLPAEKLFAVAELLGITLDGE